MTQNFRTNYFILSPSLPPVCQGLVYTSRSVRAMPRSVQPLVHEFGNSWVHFWSKQTFDLSRKRGTTGDNSTHGGGSPANRKRITRASNSRRTSDIAARKYGNEEKNLSLSIMRASKLSRLSWKLLVTKPESWLNIYESWWTARQWPCFQGRKLTW